MHVSAPLDRNNGLWKFVGSLFRSDSVIDPLRVARYNACLGGFAILMSAAATYVTATKPAVLDGVAAALFACAGSLLLGTSIAAKRRAAEAVTRAYGALRISGYVFAFVAVAIAGLFGTMLVAPTILGNTGASISPGATLVLWLYGARLRALGLPREDVRRLTVTAIVVGSILEVLVIAGFVRFALQLAVV